MTVYQSILSDGVLEAFAPGFTHTSVTRRFGVMQRALGAWIEAERDLEHSGSWDPACDHWLRDAEAARAAVGAALDALCDTPAERLEDRPLLRIARITRALALSEDGAEFARLYARVTAPGAVPLLAGGRGGIGVFMLPSAGYLIGYALAAGVIGLLMGRLPSKTPKQAALSALVASVLGGVVFLHALGIAGLVLIAQMPLEKAFLVDLAFVPGDLVKAVLCALVVHTVAKALPDWPLGGKAA